MEKIIKYFSFLFLFINCLTIGENKQKTNPTENSLSVITPSKILDNNRNENDENGKFYKNY